jgi:protoporphyrinogen oxidase
MENNTSNKKYDFVVLGGGVSGLGFAKRISENGKSVLVLEKEAIVGGLSRSLEYKGFYLDFCAHRFHTNNKDLLHEVLTLPGLTMEKHIKKSRIYMFNKWLKYPFEIQQLLAAMPLWQSFVSGLSFGWNIITKRFRKTSKLQSYKEWFIHLYGKRIYDVMCYPYTSKIWHYDPGEISADWADQRFQGENLKKLFKRVIKKILTLDFTSYDLKDDSLAPDGGPFYYPLRGIQEMCDALERASVSKGAEVLTSVTITAVDTGKKTVTFTHLGTTHTVSYEGLISTIPMHTYYALQERKNKDVEEALSGIKYMDIVFVFLFLDIPQVSNDHWLYFPDKDIIFNRAVEFSNWSPVMCPPGKTSICFDITTFKDNKEWNMSDEELTKRVIHDAVRTGYIEKKDVTDALVTKVEYAYPFYDLDYKRKLDVIMGHLEHNGVALLGRTGMFKYNNSDNSIEMGFALAEEFLKEGGKKSVYDYKIKAISL